MDFGTVDEGLTKTDYITVKNRGTVSNLILTIELVQDGLPSDNTDHWEIVDDTDVTEDPVGSGRFTVNISPGSSVDLEIKFKPSLSPLVTSENFPVVLHISSSNSDLCYLDVIDTNDGSAPQPLDVYIQLQGAVLNRPINYLLTLDKSGSMQQVVTPSTQTRLDLLKAASHFFIDLLNDRGNSADQAAIVAFNSGASLLTGLGPVDRSELVTGIVGMIAAGRTAVGQGLQLADSEAGSPPSGGKNVIILFTDGQENVGPPWMARGTPIVSYSNNPEVHTIGMGSDVTSVFQADLSTYASSHGGGYYYVPAGTTYSSGSAPIELKKAFLGIFEESSGMTGIVDPMVDVVVDASELVVGRVPLTSSEHRAVFSVFDDPEAHDLYEIKVRSPKGEVIGTGTLPSGIEGKVTEGDGYWIVSADFLNVSDVDAYSGEWTIVLSPKDTTNKKRGYKAVRIGYAVSAMSDLMMALQYVPQGLEPGSDISIAVDFRDNSADQFGVQDLAATLTDPDGNTQKISLQKDQFGKWTSSYPHTGKVGTYKLLTQARLKNSRGERAVRERTSYLALSYQEPLSQPVPCVSCGWVRLLAGLLVVLTLIVLIAFIRGSLMK
jgi:hypothetical protein